MVIPVSCSCGRQFRVSEKLAGKRAKCPSCGNGVLISGPEEQVEEAVFGIAPEETESPARRRPAVAGLVGQVGQFNLRKYGKPVQALAWATDGDRALVAVASTVLLLDVAAGKILRKFTNHNATVRSLCFSPDGRLALSAGGDSIFFRWGARGTDMLLWKTKTGEEVQRLVGHRKPVTGVAFSRDGRSILSTSQDGTMRTWKVSTGEEVASFPGGTCLAISPNGRLVLMGGPGRKVQLVALESGEQLWSGVGDTPMQRMNGVGFAADGKHGFSAGNAVLCRWSVKTGKAIFSRDMAVMRCVAFAPAGDRAVTAGGDRSPQANIPCLARGQDGEDSTVYGVCRNDVTVWKLPEGVICTSLKGHAAAIQALAFSADGQRVLSGDADGSVYVWALGEL